MILASIAFLALTASTAMAGFDYHIRMDMSSYSSGSGGEFTATAQLGGSAGLLPGAGAFQTFCVERNEYFYPGTTYQVQLNTETVGTHHVLTNAAAWLYDSFRAGTLAGYSYAGTQAQRQASARNLQYALWHFMAESTGDYGAPIANNPFVIAANSNVANAWGTDAIGNVRIMNLKDLSGNNGQDQLFVVPAPAAFALGGLGLSLLGWAKRRMA